MNEAVKRAVRDKLVGSSVAGLLSSSSAVYWGLAGEDAGLPYVVCAYAGGGAENDVQRDALDVTVTVKAVSVTSATSAGVIADAIYSAIHNQTLTYEAGWKHVKSNQTGFFEFVETVEGGQFWHAGHVFRLRLSK